MSTRFVNHPRHLLVKMEKKLQELRKIIFKPRDITPTIAKQANGILENGIKEKKFPSVARVIAFMGFWKI